MVYKVTRVTNYPDNARPCTEARFEPNPEKINNNNTSSVYDDDEGDWLIDICTLDELTEFIAKYGKCIIYPAYEFKGKKHFPEISIYDGDIL